MSDLDERWNHCCRCKGVIPPEIAWYAPGERRDGKCPGWTHTDSGLCGAFDRRGRAYYERRAARAKAKRPVDGAQ